MLKIKILFRLLLLIVLLYVVPGAFAYTTNMSASVVVGQANFSGTSTNMGGSVGAQGTGYPEGVIVIGNKFVISDDGNSRMLIYNSLPTSNGGTADVVIGHPLFTDTGGNPSGFPTAATLRVPALIGTDGTKLFVADWGNNRVLIYNTLPTSNGASANVVIGQPDMTTSSVGTSSIKMNGPNSVAYDPASGKLVVADFGNNRVLIYNSVPTSNSATADVVVGQTTMNTSGSGNTASTLNGPYSARIIQNKLFVADLSNHRVLIWNTVPTTDGIAADVVIGQSTMNAVSANQGGSAAANTLKFPVDMQMSNSELFVSDGGNNRVLIYNGIPTSNNASAVKVIGQTSLTGASSNQGGSAAANTLNGPDGNLFFANNKMYLADASNFRVLIYNDDTPPSPTPTVTGIPTSTPTPTAAPSSSTTSSPVVNNENIHPNWMKEVMAGPEFVGEVKPITDVSAPDAAALIQKDAIHDPLYMKIRIIYQEDLKTPEGKIIPPPWANGISIVSDIYDFNAVSAFNGYPIVSSDKPYTITIPYDLVKLKKSNPSRLRIAYYDRAIGRWKLLRNNSVINYEKHTISNTTTRFTYFAVGF